MYEKIKSNNISVVASVILVGLVGLSGCGSSSSDSVPSTKTVSGRAIDGYLSDSTVTLNGKSVKTTADGNWTLTYVPSTNDVVSVSGGVDSATGKAFEGILKAPISGTNINVTPLTTLVAALVSSGTNIDTAYSTVADALNITSDDLKADPVAMLATDPVKASAILTQALTLQKVAETYAEAVSIDTTMQNNVIVSVMSAVAKRLETGSLLDTVLNDTTLANSIATDLNSTDTLATDKLVAASSAAQAVVTLVRSLTHEGIIPSTLEAISQNIETKTTLIESGVRFIAVATTTATIDSAKTEVDAKVTEANSGVSSSSSSSSSSSVSSSSSSSSVSSSSSSSTYVPYVPYVPTSSSLSSSSSSSTATTTVSGRAIDGYLSGSTVTLPNGETNTTNADGNWTITFNGSAITGIISVKDGNDTSTGQAFEGVLEAPITSGPVNVTPLTTLVSVLVKSGDKNSTEAYDIVAKGLGISADNLKADPIAMLDTNQSEASKILKQALTIQKIAETFAKAVSTDATTQDKVMASVMSAVAKRLDANESFDSVVTDSNSTLANSIATDLNSTDNNLTVAKLTAASDSAKFVVSLIAQNTTITTDTFTQISQNIDGNTTVVEDNLKTVAEANTTTIITVPNIKPVLNLLDDMNKSEDFADFNITLNATDENVSSLVFGAKSDSNATVSVNGNTLRISHVPNANGVVTIDVNVTDGNLSDTKSFKLNINAVNDAPILTLIAQQTKSEDSADFNLTLSATDVDNANLTYSAFSHNTSKATVSITGNTLKISPVANANGVVTIDVNVTDGQFSNSKSFDLNITAVDDTPVLQTLSNLIKAEDDNNFSLDLNATDIDGDTITYTTSSSKPNIATVSIVNGKLVVTPVANANGVVKIDVNATANGKTVTKQFDLNITAVDDAPVLGNITNPSTKLEDFADFNITLSSTDEENDTVKYNAKSTTANITVSGNQLKISPIKDKSGSVSIDVNVTQTNNSLLFDTQTITFSVTAVNDAPTIGTTFNNIQMLEDNGTTNYELNVSDIEGGDLNVTVDSNNTALMTVSKNWTNLVQQATYNNQPLDFNLSTVKDANGIVHITITANDGDKNTTKGFDVNVTAVDDAPVSSSASSVSSSVSSSASSVSSSVSSSASSVSSSVSSSASSVSSSVSSSASSVSSSVSSSSSSVSSSVSSSSSSVSSSVSSSSSSVSSSVSSSSSSVSSSVASIFLSMTNILSSGKISEEQEVITSSESLKIYAESQVIAGYEIYVTGIVNDTLTTEGDNNLVIKISKSSVAIVDGVDYENAETGDSVWIVPTHVQTGASIGVKFNDGTEKKIDITTWAKTN